MPPSEAGAGETGAVKGKAVYQGYCSSCHGEQGDGTFLTELSLREVATATGARALEPTIKDWITGKLILGFGTTLSNEDLEALLQFLETWESQ